MSDSLQLVLRQSVEEVLEKMFFIRSLGGMAEELRSAESELSASLTFEGTPSGALILRVTQDAARSISADFLGADDGELSSQQVGEVICELANMICGSVLSRVESTATFRLATPQLNDGANRSGTFGEMAGESASHSLVIGGGSLTVLVTTESPVCSMAAKHAS